MQRKKLKNFQTEAEEEETEAATDKKHETSEELHMGQLNGKGLKTAEKKLQMTDNF